MKVDADRNVVVESSTRRSASANYFLPTYPKGQESKPPCDVDAWSLRVEPISEEAQRNGKPTLPVRPLVSALGLVVAVGHATGRELIVQAAVVLDQ